MVRCRLQLFLLSQTGQKYPLVFSRSYSPLCYLLYTFLTTLRMHLLRKKNIFPLKSLVKLMWTCTTHLDTGHSTVFELGYLFYVWNTHHITSFSIICNIFVNFWPTYKRPSSYFHFEMFAWGLCSSASTTFLNFLGIIILYNPH